ncbi:MAG: hypothetical protein P8N09_04135 [Planctomycetota bacterium]|nr:hypothetical protein [Planctomycetota bacterium]
MTRSAIRYTFVASLLVGCVLFSACSGAPRVATGAHSAPEETRAPRAGGPDAEAWAWDLVGPADGRTGDRDAIARRWLSHVAEQPGHPLAEASLRLVDAVQLDLADPLAFRKALLELGTPSGLSPAARMELDRLQAEARLADSLTDLLEEDQFPGVLKAYDVLGPLGPVQDPRAMAMEPEFIADPGFDVTHSGVLGEVRWLPLERSIYSGVIDPTDVLTQALGWCVVAARFEVPHGGPAWLEIDLGSGAGRSARGFAGAVFSYGRAGFLPLSPMASYSYSLNGEASTIVDYLGAERSALTRVPVVLRDGANRILVRMRSAYAAEISISVHAPDGSAYPGLSGGRSAAGLGVTVSEPLVEMKLNDAESYLSNEQGPGAEALLGFLQMLDRRPASGLARMEQALSRSEGSQNAVDLAAGLAGLYRQLSYLPSNWRRARSRELIEQVLNQDPDHLPMGLALAEIFAAEDREEEALVELNRLSALYPEQSRTLLVSAELFGNLGWEARQEVFLVDAVERTPRSPVALSDLASHLSSYSAERLSAPLRSRRREAAGFSPQRLEQLAYELSRSGMTEEAGRVWERALIRSPDRSRRLRYAKYLLKIDDLYEAEEQLQGLVRDFPTWVGGWRVLADVALRLGNRELEREALLQVIHLEPSDRPTRDRLSDLGFPDPVETLRERFLLTTAEALERYTDTVRDDSVVRILDQAAVQLYADGSAETITHEIVQVRDLDACEREGELRLDGEVLRLATLKQKTGEVFEPVRVSGSYVMPQLEPGDFIERITRSKSSDASLVVRPGRWFFRSVSEPFVVSRYVIAVPRSLGVRFELHGRVDRHETFDVGDDVVHVFESLEQPRVLLEPGTPPGAWFLPWVEFGMDDDADSFASIYRTQLLPFVEVTPEISRAARDALVGVTGQEEAARALYDFVNETLVQRSTGPVPAVQTLLSKSGNPILLYVALLDAAGIENDLVWSRGVAPAADPDPTPAFIDMQRVQNELLAVVRPDDGPEAWCAMSARTLPYGELMGDAPGAVAYTVKGGEWIQMPEGDESSKPGVRVNLEVNLALDGSAEVSGEFAYLGAWGFAAKQQIREAPEIHHRNFAESIASGVLPGLELKDYSIVGLHDREPLAFRFSGHAPRFLDADGGRPMPIRRLEMSRDLAIEGQRNLPFLQNAVSVNDASIALRLPEGMKLMNPPPSFRETYGGQVYELSLAQGDDAEWILTRDFSQQPFSIEPEEYPELLGFARRVDEAERAWLRFSNSESSGR